jgi:hypothetical protein
MAIRSSSGVPMACRYFMPTERLDDSAWIHPSRLPLAAGWTGQCTAPGHEGEIPSEQQVRDCCNLGYAKACSFRPADRDYDSVRFGVMRDSDDFVLVRYVCERDHVPADHGTLEYSKVSGWLRSHSDARIQKMADCYVTSYFARRIPVTTAAVASS